MIQTQAERFRYMTGNVSTKRLDDTFHEHLEIICACLKDDWTAAAEKMTYHLEQSKRSTFELIFNNLSSQDLTLSLG